MFSCAFGTGLWHKYILVNLANYLSLQLYQNKTFTLVFSFEFFWGTVLHTALLKARFCPSYFHLNFAKLQKISAFQNILKRLLIMICLQLGSIVVVVVLFFILIKQSCSRKMFIYLFNIFIESKESDHVTAI